MSLAKASHTVTSEFNKAEMENPPIGWDITTHNQAWRQWGECNQPQGRSHKYFEQYYSFSQRVPLHRRDAEGIPRSAAVRSREPQEESQAGGREAGNDRSPGRCGLLSQLPLWVGAEGERWGRRLPLSHQLFWYKVDFKEISKTIIFYIFKLFLKWIEIYLYFDVFVCASVMYMCPMFVDVCVVRTILFRL